MEDELGAPPIVDRSAFQAELDALRVRKAHTREGDALAAARRRLPMVEAPASTPLIGKHGPVTLLDTFEGRRLLIAYYFMWHTGKPAPEQCEGCTWVTSQVRELSYIHARDATYAVFCQGPYEESRRYCNFMAWEMPWYSALGSLETLFPYRDLGDRQLRVLLAQPRPDAMRRVPLLPIHVSSQSQLHALFVVGAVSYRISSLVNQRIATIFGLGLSSKASCRMRLSLSCLTVTHFA